MCMSIIHTCELNGVHPFDYLVAPGQQSPEELSGNAAAWMPWNYKHRLKTGPRPTIEKNNTTAARLSKAHFEPD